MAWKINIIWWKMAKTEWMNQFTNESKWQISIHLWIVAFTILRSSQLAILAPIFFVFLFNSAEKVLRSAKMDNLLKNIAPFSLIHFNPFPSDQKVTAILLNQILIGCKWHDNVRTLEWKTSENIYQTAAKRIFNAKR